jgi:hypothetical protein
VNYAGTAYVNILKINASNQTEFTNTATHVFNGPISATAGILPYGSAFPWMWVLNYTPISSTSGTNTAGVTNQQWIGSVWVPVTMTVTGVAYLIGTTGGTDKAIVALYDAAGTLLANSLTTGGGTTVGTGSTIQSLDFTATYTAKGPARYFVSVQYTGATAKIQTIPLGVGLTAVNARGTLTTPGATITVPTTFTADYAPVAALY